MGRLSTNLKAEIATTGPALHWGLEIQFPDQTRRYSSTGYSSAAHGHYEAKVLRWGTIRRAVSDRGNRLQSVTTSVEIDDTDKEFSSLLAGAYGRRVVDSVAIIRLMSPTLAPADWLTEFTGRLTGWGPAGRNVWRLEFGPIDAPLRGSVPKVLISRTDFPNAKEDVVGMAAPLLYGAPQLEADLPWIVCPYVDTVGFRYLVSYGPLITYAANSLPVPNVYADGVVVNPANYTVDEVTINGRIYTLINFTGDQGDAIITADAYGFDVKGTSYLGAEFYRIGQDFLFWPAQMQHWLANFVWGNYQRGDFLALATAPIDTASWDRVQHEYMWKRASVFGMISGRKIDEEKRALEYLEEGAQSFDVSLYWTGEGKIAAAIEDPAALDNYGDDPWLRPEDASIEGPENAGYERFDRAKIKTGYRETLGTFAEEIEVRDQGLSLEVAETLEQRWNNWRGETFGLAIGRETASRRLRQYARPASVYRAKGGLKLIDSELMSRAWLTTAAAPHAQGLGAGYERWARLECSVREVSVDPNTNTVTLTLWDLRGYRTTLWDVATSLKCANDRRDGIPELSSGCFRHFARSGSLYVLDTNSDKVVSVAANVEAYEAQGQLIEAAGTNEIVNPAFITSAFSGWTQNEGGGSSITEETSEPLLFEAAITPRCALFTAAATPSVDLLLVSSATASHAAGSYVCLSVDHIDPSGGRIRWIVYRNFDNRWWNALSESWEAAEVWNPFEIRQDSITRDVTPPIPVGANASTFLVAIVQAAAEALPNQQNRVFFVQFEGGRYATSRMISTRNTARQSWTNNEGYRCWPEERVTATLQVRPVWGTVEVPDEPLPGQPDDEDPEVIAADDQDRYLLHVVHDADNAEFLFYDQSEQAMTYRVRVAGVNYDATKVAQVEHGELVGVACRRTSTEGELGMPARTISVFVNGEKGTDATIPALPTEQEHSRLVIGMKYPDVATPAGMSGLVAWWDADHGVWRDTARTLIARELEAVAGWTDRSGAGNHLSQATAGLRSTYNRPPNAYNAAYTNLDRYIRPDSDFPEIIAEEADGKYYLTSGNVDFTGADHTIFIVTRRWGSWVGTQVLAASFASFSTAGTNWWEIAADASNLYYARSATASSGIQAAHVISDSAASLITARHNNAGGGTQVLRVNGAQVASGTGNWTGSNQPFFVGGWNGFHANQRFREIVVFNAALSDADMLRVERWLMLKWHIAWNIDTLGTALGIMDGTYRNLDVCQLVLTDEEIAQRASE